MLSQMSAPVAFIMLPVRAIDDLSGVFGGLWFYATDGGLPLFCRRLTLTSRSGFRSPCAANGWLRNNFRCWRLSPGERIGLQPNVVVDDHAAGGMLLGRGETTWLATAGGPTGGSLYMMAN